MDEPSQPEVQPLIGGRQVKLSGTEVKPYVANTAFDNTQSYPVRLKNHLSNRNSVAPKSIQTIKGTIDP